MTDDELTALAKDPAYLESLSPDEMDVLIAALDGMYERSVEHLRELLTKLELQ